MRRPRLSFTHTELVADSNECWQAVFYPGWDDNGCPPTKRSELLLCACDRADLRRAFTPAEAESAVSVTAQFHRACTRMTQDDEKAFENLWRHLGLSGTGDLTYATSASRSSASRRRHYEALGRGRPIRSRTRRSGRDFRTAVAQARSKIGSGGAYTGCGFRCQRSSWRSKPRAELLPGARHGAHPDDAPTAAVSGLGAGAVVRGANTGQAHRSPTRKGQWHRDDLYVRRPTDVTWWVTVAARAPDSSRRTLRPVTFGFDQWPSPPLPARRRLRPAGGPVGMKARSRSWSCCSQRCADWRSRPINHQ